MNNRSRARIESPSPLLTPRKLSRRSVAPGQVLSVCPPGGGILTLLTWKVKNRVPVAFFENAVLSITRPLRAATWTTRSLREVWGNYIYLVSVQRDNQRLREEIKWLRQEKPSISGSVSAISRAYSGY